MTQKELLYVEDAIGHENCLIKICEFSKDNVSDEDLVSFFDKQIKEHTSFKDELMDLLEEKANE